MNYPNGDDENKEQYLSEKQQLEIAELIKTECLKAAIDGYEDAKMSGLCHEGAWDLALDHIKALDVKRVLKLLSK